MALCPYLSPQKDSVRCTPSLSKSSTRLQMLTKYFPESRAASPSDQAPDVNKTLDITKTPEVLSDARNPPPPDAGIMAGAKKPKTLAQIAAEGRAFRRAAMPVAAGSAFDILTQKNKAFSNGTTRRDEFNTRNGDGSCSPLVKKVKVPNRIIKSKKKPKAQIAQKLPSSPIPSPPPPVIESWRTATGGMCSAEGPATPTPFLGIARVPTWKEQDFKTALRVILDTVGGAEEFATNVHESGGEFYSEISARFVDEVVAGEVLEKINGVMCHGRTLQVSFASEF